MKFYNVKLSFLKDKENDDEHYYVVTYEDNITTVVNHIIQKSNKKDFLTNVNFFESKSYKITFASLDVMDDNFALIVKTY